MSLVLQIMEAITKQGEDLGIEVAASPRQLNAVVAAANAIVHEFATDDVMSQPGQGVEAWLASDDTGTSSKAMCRKLCGRGNGESDHPWDPADFGRCYRFLQAVPAARADLPRMAEVSPVWKRLVEHWSELEALYLEELPTGSGPKLYARMKELIK
jgi:hypothetical protein